MSQNPGVADGAMNYAGGDQIAYADGNGSAQISGGKHFFAFFPSTVPNLSPTSHQIHYQKIFAFDLFIIQIKCKVLLVLHMHFRLNSKVKLAFFGTHFSLMHFH